MEVDEVTEPVASTTDLRSIVRAAAHLIAAYASHAPGHEGLTLNEREAIAELRFVLAADEIMVAA